MWPGPAHVNPDGDERASNNRFGAYISTVGRDFEPTRAAVKRACARARVCGWGSGRGKSDCAQQSVCAPHWARLRQRGAWPCVSSAKPAPFRQPLPRRRLWLPFHARRNARRTNAQRMRNRIRSVADADWRGCCAALCQALFAFFVARRRAGESTHLLLPPRVLQHVYKRLGVPATAARRGREGIG